MINFSTLPDETWLQVKEFVIGEKGKNANAPVRFGRSTWLTMVRKGQAPMGRGQGTNRVWRWGDVKAWVIETNPPTEAAILAEIDLQEALKSPYDAAMALLTNSDVQSVVITKAPLSGFTFTINKTKGKPINYWVGRRTTR